MFKNNYDAVEFGARVRSARKRSGMTQEQLAEKLILSVDSVSRIENGKGMCMPEHVVHICEILNVSSDYLYFGKTDKCVSGKDDVLSRINEMLGKCDERELKRVEKMMELLLAM